MNRYPGFVPYVNVAEHKRKAAKEVRKLKKQGLDVQPVVLEGRTIATKIWGKAWCAHLESSYREDAHCLRRGRRYVRQGSVIDLAVTEGKISGLVSERLRYPVEIVILKVADAQWDTLVNECFGKIDSLLALLRGELSKAVIEILIGSEKGLLPRPQEITFHCTCSAGTKLCDTPRGFVMGQVPISMNMLKTYLYCDRLIFFG